MKCLNLAAAGTRKTIYDLVLRLNKKFFLMQAFAICLFESESKK